MSGPLFGGKLTAKTLLIGRGMFALKFLFAKPAVWAAILIELPVRVVVS